MRMLCSIKRRRFFFSGHAGKYSEQAAEKQNQEIYRADAGILITEQLCGMQLFYEVKVGFLTGGIIGILGAVQLQQRGILCLGKAINNAHIFGRRHLKPNCLRHFVIGIVDRIGSGLTIGIIIIGIRAVQRNIRKMSRSLYAVHELFRIVLTAHIYIADIARAVILETDIINILSGRRLIFARLIRSHGIRKAVSAVGQCHA